MRDEPQLLRTSVTVGDASTMVGEQGRTTLSNISTELNDHQQRRTTVGDQSRKLLLPLQRFLI
jgi:hypothetical protein